MSSLVRIVYASTAANPSSPTDSGINHDVGRILMQSRKDNREKQIGGVLYFSNDYFFQCLEGDSAAVNALFNKISQDPRHTDVRSLSVKPVEKRLFSDWSMKYVALQDDVNRLLEANHFKMFEPYEFSDALIDQMLELFVIANDPTAKDEPVSKQKTSKKSSWPGRVLKRLMGK